MSSGTCGNEATDGFCCFLLSIEKIKIKIRKGEREREKKKFKGKFSRLIRQV